jgi:hypothetical protein
MASLATPSALCLERIGQLWVDLSKEAGDRVTGKTMDFAGKVGLVGIPCFERKVDRLRMSGPCGQLKETLKSDDSIESLQAVPEHFVAAPAQGPFAQTNPGRELGHASGPIRHSVSSRGRIESCTQKGRE